MELRPWVVDLGERLRALSTHDSGEEGRRWDDDDEGDGPWSPPGPTLRRDTGRQNRRTPSPRPNEGRRSDRYPSSSDSAYQRGPSRSPPRRGQPRCSLTTDVAFPYAQRRTEISQLTTRMSSHTGVVEDNDEPKYHPERPLRRQKHLSVSSSTPPPLSASVSTGPIPLISRPLYTDATRPEDMDAPASPYDRYSRSGITSILETQRFSPSPTRTHRAARRRRSYLNDPAEGTERPSTGASRPRASTDLSRRHRRSILAHS